MITQILEMFIALGSFEATAGSFVLLGQASLPGVVSQVIGIFRLIAFMLAVIGVVYSGIRFSQGDVAAAGYGIIGSGIVALSGVIVYELFEVAGTDIPVINF